MVFSVNAPLCTVVRWESCDIYGLGSAGVDVRVVVCVCAVVGSPVAMSELAGLVNDQLLPLSALAHDSLVGDGSADRLRLAARSFAVQATNVARAEGAIVEHFGAAAHCFLRTGWARQYCTVVLGKPSSVSTEDAQATFLQEAGGGMCLAKIRIYAKLYVIHCALLAYDPDYTRRMVPCYGNLLAFLPIAQRSRAPGESYVVVQKRLLELWWDEARSRAVHHTGVAQLVMVHHVNAGECFVHCNQSQLIWCRDRWH